MGRWIDRERGWFERPEADRREPPPAAPAAPSPRGEPEPTAAVYWLPVFCPFCRGRDCPVTASPRGVSGMRHHQCRTCGGRFKSFEREPPPPRAAAPPTSGLSGR